MAVSQLSSRDTVAKVLFIAGTTAVGKSDLSLELAKTLNGEIVSADSVQVYRHMDIGSAKVDGETRTAIPHHLIDVVDPCQNFSVGEYCKMARSAIEEIISRGRVPIVVGGTSFYFNFLLKGATGAPESTTESREVVDKLLEEDMGDWDKSLTRLNAIDPEYAATLFANDWYRLKRALDICLQSGRTVSSFKQDLSSGFPYKSCCLFLTMPRVSLFKRIDTRCEAIVKTGLLKETCSLLFNDGLMAGSQAGHSIGYRQAIDYLKQVWDVSPVEASHAHVSEIPEEEMKKSFLSFLEGYQARTRQLAQNQLMWFKREPHFQWLNVAPGGQMLSLPLVAEKVSHWFTEGVPLPSEWDGSSLKVLTREEQEQLRTYFPCLKLFSDEEQLLGVLSDLKKHISSFTIK